MTDYTDKACDLADQAIDQRNGLRHARDWWKDACEKATKRGEEADGKVSMYRRKAELLEIELRAMKSEVARQKREVNNLRGKLAEAEDRIDDGYEREDDEEYEKDDDGRHRAENDWDQRDFYEEM